MTKAGLRMFGATAVALSALLVAVGDVSASNLQPAVAHYVEPRQGDYVRVAGLFGESDEEKAARLQHEADQDGQIATLNNKLRDLEDTVRNLTGQNEELSHRLSELNAKIDKQQKDFEYRLCAMAAQQLGASTGEGDANAVPCPGGTGGGTAYNSPPPAQRTPSDTDELGGTIRDNGRGGGVDGGGRSDGGGRDSGGRQLAPPPGVLGTLPAGNTGAAPSRGDTGASDDSRTQFSNAMNLLAKARYDEASAAFRAFADTHPKDDLAPQAVYWVADIAYVQKDYAGATRGFAEVIKKYPDSVRAPDSMLKLGQSLIAAGQKPEGCTALAALPDKYPKASKALLAQGADARKANCRKSTS
jgi:tol-pal system protein YbgF